MVFEVQFNGFLTLEAETSDEAFKQALDWQKFVETSAETFDRVETDNHIQKVELSLEDAIEIDPAELAAQPRHN